MCLLHCMLTCRHTAAGTWFLERNNTTFPACSPFFKLETFQDRKLPSLSPLTRQDVWRQRSSMFGDDRHLAQMCVTVPRAGVFSHILQTFWCENKCTKLQFAFEKY